MSWSLVIGSLLFLVVVAVSIWLRMVVIRHQRHLATGSLPQEPIPSLFSQALVQLVGVAGGIYLALVMVVSFLKIQLPGEISVLGLRVEPLAFVSTILALVQPFVQRFWLR